jgi:hypothetical protein
LENRAGLGCLHILSAPHLGCFNISAASIEDP